jgi:hypothetical protein
MRDEKKRATSVAFRLLHAGDKDRNQLVGFLLEGVQLIRWHDFTLHEEFEPVRGFLQFLKSYFELADELSS